MIVSKLNEAWILHREELYTTYDGHCNVYLLLDAYSQFCFGHIVSVDLPSAIEVNNLLNNAKITTGHWPQQILIAKSDPYCEILKSITQSLDIKTSDVPYSQLRDFVKPFREPFNKAMKGAISPELEAFIPQTYELCPCASGKKFKFCCQKAFYDISEAMSEAEEGNLGAALYFMQKAESKVGLTAEILCRYAICWSFFNSKISSEYLKQALQKNPNHPRTNYILGIEASVDENDAKAIEYYQKAIAHYPQSDKYHLNEVLNNLGSAYYRLFQYSEAKAAWERALVLLPSDGMVKENLIEFIYENPEIPTPMREMSPFIKRYLAKQSQASY